MSHFRYLSLVSLVLPLAVAACGSSTPTGANAPPPSAPSSPSTPAANDIDIVPNASLMTSTAFAPNPKTVALGQDGSVVVRWVNGDVVNGGGGGPYGNGTGMTATAHNITSDDGTFAPSGILPAGNDFPVTFRAAGTYRFHCSIHPNMVGSVVVTR